MPHSDLTFFSRKHTVRLIPFGTSHAVEKAFSEPDDFCQESACYVQFLSKGLSVPALLGQHDRSLILQHIPGPTALELLERNEARQDRDPAPWQDLAQWCCRFYQQTGLCLGDPNLRNFILHEPSRQWYGVDFEACQPGDPAADFAQLLAYLLLYRPECTAYKHWAAEVMRRTFSEEMSVSEQTLFALQEEAVSRLEQRRALRKR